MARVQLEAILKLTDVQINPAVFQKISRAVAGLPPALRKTDEGLKGAGRSTDGLNRKLGQTKVQLTKNERAARMFLRRMAQFAILLPTFATLNRAIQGSVKFLFEFDSALRDIVRIDIEGLGDRMEEVGDAAIQTAKDFGVTATEVLNVTRVFKQAGFTIEESQNKARAAILATQVSTLNSVQATEVFIAAQKQFGAEGKNAIDVLDRLAKVEDQAAVNAGDVADAFRTGGNALAFFTKDIDDSIGLIAALREQTRKSGREIGTFFKTFATRATAAGEARDAIERLGVTIANLDGTLRPGLDILNDLGDAFNKLTEEQQATAAKQISGVRQFESLLGVMKSLDRANQLAAASSSAAGTADAKRAVTDEKLERQLGKLIAQGQALAESLGDAGLEKILVDALKSATALLGIFTGMVEVVDDLGGSLAPLLALGGVSLGRSIFGIAGGGGGKKAPGVGSRDFVGPIKPSRSPKGLAQSVSRQLTPAFGAAFGLLMSTVGTVIVQKTFDNLEKKADELGGSFGTGAAQFTGVVGASASMAAQFAFLGPQAAGLAAVFGGLLESVSRTTDAYNDHFVAVDDQTKLEVQAGKNAGLRVKLGGSGASGKALGTEFINILKSQVAGANIGQELAKGIGNAMKQFSSSSSLSRLGLEGASATDALFGDISTFKKFVSTQEDYIGSIAEGEGNLESFNELIGGLGDGSLTTGEAFRLLVEALGAGVGEINEITNELKRTLSFGEFEAARDVSELAESIRTMRLELELAELAPADLADSVIRMQQGLLLAEREITNTNSRLEESLGNLFSNLGSEEFGVGIGSEAQSISKFFTSIVQGSKDLDIQAINEFDMMIRDLPETQRKAATEIMKILESQLSNEIGLASKRQKLAEEIGKRRESVARSEAEAAMMAMDATDRFTAELLKFGDAVTTDVLASVQGLSLGDVQDVMGGGSGLSEGIQQLIQSAFGDDLVKAQNNLQAVAIKTQTELDILTRKLVEVDKELSGSAGAANEAALVAKKLSLELDIEKTSQQGLIAATEGKIKVLRAEQKAEDDAAEAARKRADLLDRLADAASDFDSALRSVNQDFEDFVKQRSSDLLGQEADAQQGLKDAQQGVLDSTVSLADAYASLMDAQLQYNNAIAEAEIKSSLLARDIGMLTGSIVTFDDKLSSIGNAFRDTLNDSNITLAKRIDLERQLAEETLSFLQRARAEITQAGLGIFGQTGQQNQELQQGISGLQFVADQLGGSFEAFQNLSSGEFEKVSQSLLALPASLRQQILDALSFLPSSTSIGGFSVEQLQQAIGQVGAGVNAEEGIPSIEELNNQQVEQLKVLQDLAMQDAALQFEQVARAQEQLALAEEQLDVSKLLEERAREDLGAVRDAVLEEKAILDLANAQRQELLMQVIAADDKNTLMQIEREAQMFADQNSVFRDVGDQIVRGVSAAIGARLSVISAEGALNAATGFVPNFASGNLSPGEAAGLLRAASREKRGMPAGAGLAVANTSEAIIPMHGGHIPNFQGGNLSPIAAGVDAIKGINETVVAAIARSVTQALSDVGGGSNENRDLLENINLVLSRIQSELEDISTTSGTTASNTTTANQSTGTPGAGVAGGQDVRIVLETNQRNEVNVVGVDDLPNAIREAVREASMEQADAQVEPLLRELEAVFIALRERGMLTSLGQPG